MKIALLQCNPVTGDIVGNVERIAAAVEKAKADNADLCVTPEMALSGAVPRNYLSLSEFVEGCRKGLDLLASRFADGPELLVGAPVKSVYDPHLLSNAAVHIRGGHWDVVSRKVRPEASHDIASRFFDRGVSCGLLNLCGWRLGVVLCENEIFEGFWNVKGPEHNPLLDLFARGVDAILFMSAMPYTMGRRARVEAVLSHVAARQHVYILAVNMVGGNGGLVYGGQSLAFDPTGQVFARGRAFEEDVLVVDSTSEVSSLTPPSSCWEEGALGAIILGTRDFVRKCGLERAVVGLSGGMDSALVLAVAAEALGPQNVTAVLMPSPYSSSGSVDDSEQLAANLGVRRFVVPIEPLMKSFEAAMSPACEVFATYPGDFTFENVQARIRGTLLTSIANRAKALVLNTGNKSESAVGYSTLYGDAVGAIGVIADLTKTQVYSVARWYNKSRGMEIIPEAIFTKAPSAELRPGQKDSDSLPPYEELDPILEAYLSAEPRAPLADLGPRAEEVRTRLFRSEFKRRQAPPALCVSSKPFCRAWSVPLAARYRLPK